MADTPDARPSIDLTALKGLAHPLRVQLLDELSAYGPSTASALAERLGESSGATSYHLRQLEKHGFVQEDASRGVGRERWWERVPQPINLEIERDADPVQRAASELVVGEWQRSRERRLHEFLAHGVEDLSDDWIKASTVSTANLPLTKEQSGALVTELTAVFDRYHALYRGQVAEGARPFQIHLDVFPLLDGVVQVADVRDVGGSGKSNGR
ncbi:ArsR/SmtB family transcription factor [Pseudolysinimonas sp.]|jgi:DNA-binding transcriptional ArsR family regulator|uniref:ArsR/SmtB family transcription factor n=1 Tax=Pseudolysinimonas sp. TaxID=2680009 RepID=UPI003782E856